MIENPPVDLTLRIFVRSRAKLLGLLPILQSRTDVEIIEGKLTDREALMQCLNNSAAIFSCIATNQSEPGTSIATDTAAAIIDALHRARERTSASVSSWEKPLVVILSSASVGEGYSGHPPAPIYYIVQRALHYLYEDLRQTQQLYRDLGDRDPALLDFIFVQPPGIMPGEVPTGYKFSTDYAGGVVSFADLGAGMVELAERRNDFLGRGVSVIATGEVKQDWRDNLKALVVGLLAYFLPWVWQAGKKLSLW